MSPARATGGSTETRPQSPPSARRILLGWSLSLHSSLTSEMRVRLLRLRLVIVCHDKGVFDAETRLHIYPMTSYHAYDASYS